jgi:hypothetical protein
VKKNWRVVLIIDEPVLLLHGEHSVLKADTEFTSLISKISLLQDDHNPSVAVVWSTLKVAPFSHSATASGRPIVGVGLECLSIGSLAGVLLETFNDQLVIRDSSNIPPERWAKFLASVTAGHPRTFQFLFDLFRDNRNLFFNVEGLLSLMLSRLQTEPTFRLKSHMFNLSLALLLGLGSLKMPSHDYDYFRIPRNVLPPFTEPLEGKDYRSFCR